VREGGGDGREGGGERERAQHHRMSPQQLSSEEAKPLSTSKLLRARARKPDNKNKA